MITLSFSILIFAGALKLTFIIFNEDKNYIYPLKEKDIYGLKTKTSSYTIYSDKIPTINEMDNLLSDYNSTKGTDNNTNSYFIGVLTSYGPDCKGCSGIIGCGTGQNAKNGNIYYTDKIFGKIRIVAADPVYPCGTIIKMSNLYFSSEPIIAVVLDRGGAVKGEKFDLLYETEGPGGTNGTQKNVQFEILRWGWNE
jgi:3D (Asp-Asp-Asp) domain-containing protein